MTTPTMRRVALLGGSFNPPHIAHQMLCLWALSAGRADQVWMVPCDEHAFGKKLLAFEHRHRMCALSAEVFVEGRVCVSSVEQEIGGRSRTLHTVRRLIADNPSCRFSLLVGADILAEKDSWYRFDEIERLVDLLVVGRSGYPGPTDAIALPPVSSTAIRERLQNGQPVDHLLPAAVLRYIDERGLYRRAEGRPPRPSEP